MNDKADFLEQRIKETKIILETLGISSLEMVTYDVVKNRFVFPPTIEGFADLCEKYCTSLSDNTQCHDLEKAVREIKAVILEKKKLVADRKCDIGLIIGLTSTMDYGKIIFVFVFLHPFKKRTPPAELQETLNQSSIPQYLKGKILETYSQIPHPSSEVIECWRQRLDQIKQFIIQLILTEGELPFINEMVREINALKFDVDHILEKIKEASIQLTGADRGCLLLVKEGKGIERLYGCGAEHCRRCWQLDKNQSAIKKALVTGEYVRIEDTLLEEYAQKYMFGERVRSELNVPLLHEEKKMGVIHVSSDVPNTFTDHHIKLLTIFAGHAAIALANARLYQEMLHREELDVAKARGMSQELATLLKMNKYLFSEKNPEKILYAFLTGLTHKEGCGFPRAFLFLYDEGRKELRGRMGVGALTQEDAERKWAAIEFLSLKFCLDNFEKIITDPVVKSFNEQLKRIILPYNTDNTSLVQRKSMRYENFSEFNPSIAENLSVLKIQKPFAIVPLWSKSYLLGVVIVDCSFSLEKTNITDEDLEILNLFSNKTALALENTFFQKESAVLNTVSRALAEKLLEWDNLLRKTVFVVRDTFPALWCSIFIMNEGRQLLELKASTGSCLEEILQEGREIVYAPGEGLTGWIAKTGRSLRLDECKNKEEFRIYGGLDIKWQGKSIEEDTPKPGLTAFLGVPIKRGTHVKGVIRIARKPGNVFTYQEEKLLETIAAYLAVILETAEQVKSLKDAVYRVGHDCYTPLANLETILDRILKRKIPEGREKKYEDMALASIKRFRQIITNLYYMGRLDLGLLNIHKKWVDISTAFNNCKAFTLYDEPAMKKNIKVDISLPPKTKEVWVDQDALESIICNLISNAFKFSNPNKNILVNVKDEKERIIFEIINIGPIISPSDQSAIFSQVPLWHRKSRGLGLIITKQLVEMQGGKIWVESEEKAGTKFTFTLPKPEGES